MKNVYFLSFPFIVFAFAILACFGYDLPLKSSQFASCDFGLEAASVLTVAEEYLSDEEFKSYQTGPSYDWMSSASISLKPYGSWDRFCAYQKVDDTKGPLRLTQERNKSIVLQNPNDDSPSSNWIVHFSESDENTIAFRSSKSKKDELAVLLGEYDDGSTGYVMKKEVELRTGEAMILYYGWIYSPEKV